MSAVANGTSKRYSWWWDSHISPKNSKWLHENLTDMDSKVKQMIKVIEEDADSFARRAEMYYKKRPELMKLVEEFYRAYRALAERYDHATGVIRHAQQTMAEAFPNQDPVMFGEESPVGSSTDEFDPQTPENYLPIRAPEEALGISFPHMSTVKRNIAFMEEPQSVSNVQGLKTGRARKGLNFNDIDGKGRNAKVLSESERASKSEAQIVALKDALSKVQAEKEAKLAQFDQNLERLSNLEFEVSRAQEDSRGFNERATRAEAEVKTLRESLSKLEVEKVSSLLQYQQCLQNIADLEDRISLAQKEAGEVNERASRAEAETLALKQSLVRYETDKEAALVQYKQCLETISNLEERLRKAEEDSRLINQRAENTKCEIESLKQNVSKLNEENVAYELQYQQCLDTIADLKLRLFHAQEETQRLSREIEDGVAKLKFAEEKCVVLERSNQNLHSELDGLLEKLGNQSHELTEKQKEMGRLWTCVQEEHLRFMEAETAFQTLQQLHSQSQEELSTLAFELQNRSQILKDMEARNNGLQEEVQEAKDENKSLSELNLSSAASIKSLQDEVSRLRETIQKLEAEVELRVDQRNALQQEIYCLKEELSQIGKKHQFMVEQVELVGLHPEVFGPSVKELQEENSKLKEIKERESIEKTALLEKLEMMENLVKKNLLLESSISDLNSELETIRGKLKTLEEATENSQKLSEGNRLLETSRFDANAELEELNSKLKSLEDSCHLLNDEKSSLVNERESLLSHMDIMRKSIEALEKEQAELKVKVSELATERESSLQRIEELGMSLDSKIREYASFVQFSESRINGMESKIHHLQDENQCREREYQVELDRAHDAHVEIIVLQKCLQEWLEKSSSLIAENQNIKKASKLLEKLISELEQENNGKQVQIESSINCIKILRTGIYQVLMKLEIIPDSDSGHESLRDQKNICDILSRLDEMQTMLLKIRDENHHSAIENLVLVEFLQQLKSEAVDIATEKKILEKELEYQCQQLLFSQDESQKLIFMNGELTTKVNQGVNREEDKDKQVLKLREDYDEHIKKNGHANEANLKLEADLMNVLMKLERIKVEKEKLNHELSKERNEVELWESQASTLFGDLQISVAHETILKGLTHELAEACKNLENRSTLKDMEIDQRVNNIEVTNKGQSDLMNKKLAVEVLKTSSARRSRRKNGSLRKQNNDINREESEMITKDIVLDQVSDCSSCGISKGDILKIEDDHSFELKLQKPQKGKSLSEESLIVDKLEISDRFTDPNKEVNKRKVLERLDSDLQKLSNLHNAVEDLKSKVDREEKGKENEYEMVKGQINEAEEALEKLLSINRKLMTKVASGFERQEGSKSSMDLDENESSRRRRISEQARRGSEKIGRLQLEIQRLQFLLLKLEGEREDRAKAKMTDIKTRVLLRDYIYDGVRGERRKKMKNRFAFCGCVQPPPSP